MRRIREEGEDKMTALKDKLANLEDKKKDLEFQIDQVKREIANEQGKNKAGE